MSNTTTVPTVPTVADAAGRDIEKGTKGVLAQLGDEVVVLTRVEVKSKRFVVKTLEGQTLARKANTVRVLRAHGRMVKAGSKTAEKFLPARDEAQA